MEPLLLNNAPLPPKLSYPISAVLLVSVRDSPIFPRCQAQLIKKKSQGEEDVLAHGSCSDTKSTFTNAEDLSHVVFDYETSYPRLRDLPPAPPYLRKFRVGVVATSGLLTIRTEGQLKSEVIE